MSSRHKDEELIRNRLAEEGVLVDSIWDLVNTKESYKEVLPTLRGLLSEVRDPRTKEGVIRALSVRGAGEDVARALVSEFHTATRFSLKWAIGNALEVVATDAIFDDLVEIVRDKEHGKAREMVALALARCKESPAVPVLVEALQDEEIAGHAVKALGKLRAVDATDEIRPFLQHPKEWYRKAAATALRQIERAREKRKNP